jgi:hypothetical protein
MRSRKRSRPQVQRSKSNKQIEFGRCRSIKAVAQRQIHNKVTTHYSPPDVFLPGANKANHITGYETEVVNLTGHRFDGIFALFAQPRTGKSACFGPRLVEPV